MYESLHYTVGRSRLTRAIVRSLSASALSLLLAGVAGAATFPTNLGNGLDKVVQAKSKLPAYQNSAAAEQGNAMYDQAIKDSEGRVLVRINPQSNGKHATIAVRTLANNLAANIASVQVTAIDDSYRNVGVMDAWVDINDVPALARSEGVRSVILEVQPRHNQSVGSGTSASNGDTFTKVGTFFDQGVLQHRVDQINKTYNPLAPVDYEGQGMSIGFISNCYAANGAHPASLDVTNFDLPGDPLNPINTTPVVVLQDDPPCQGIVDDEGRGMVQIGYHMAPKAALAFATADIGEVQFADNIRALAGLAGFTYPGQTFAADTICDDVGYFDEPFFQDGIIGAGVNDVTAAGVSYFSSAANDVGVNGYDSDIRLVPNGTGFTSATNAALAGTNIDLTNVPANLYAGGFHNFNPVPGQLDVAQTVNIGTNNAVVTILQWNDPYDQNGGVTPGAQVYAGTGTFSGTAVIIDETSTPPLPTFTAGQNYQINEHATSGDYDAIVSVIDPNGNVVIGPQDSNVDETVTFKPLVSGQYKLKFESFNNTTGSFSVTVNEVTITQLVLSDWNLLVFRVDTGAYLPGSSLTADNIATNEPVQFGVTNHPSGATQVQYVLARANTPPAGQRAADHIRYLIPGNNRPNFGPAEYFTYNTVTTAGHAMAEGTNGVAAYSAFRPSLPEQFTSPGPVRIYFDADGNALPLPIIRRQPRIAATDQANISANEGLAGLGADSASDLDTAANFGGTSAAAPHAAAIGALVLEAHGGRHSLTPAQMTTILENSTFRHDLDPTFASGFAHTSDGELIRITINSDNTTANGGTGLNDTNSFAISYEGSGGLTSLTFNPEGTALTGGNVTGGNNGYQDGTAPSLTYFENSFPGLVFATGNKPFTVSTQSSIAQGSVTATFSHPAAAPATNLPYTMGLAFDGTFTDGKTLRFVVGRAAQHNSNVSLAGGTGSGGGGSTLLTWADAFGGGVSLPSGVANLDGMTFTGTTSSGGTFSGVLRNRVQKGYSPLDGYGFINAQQAVGAPAP